MKPPAFLLLIALPLAAQPPPGDELAWSGDFDGPSLDTAKWMYRTGVRMDSSQRPENVSVLNGWLVIHLRKENHPSGGVRGPVNFWLAAIAYQKLAGKIDESSLPGRMIVDRAAFYKKSP